MRILVIGSEGNIGVHLVRELRNRGHKVLRADCLPGWSDDYVQANIVYPNDLLPAFFEFRPEVVYHLAAMVSRVTCENSPHMAVDTNISGTNNIAQFCKAVGARLVYFSTSEVYGNLSGEMSEDIPELVPTNRYGLTKYLGEKLVEYEHREHGLQVIILRPFMFYHEDESRGSHRSAMIRFAECLSKGEKITVHRNSARGWLHVDDAVRAIAQCSSLTDYHIINIGHPHIVETEWLANYMAKLLRIDADKYIELTDLPSRMTLHKYPCLKKQADLLGFAPIIDIEEGVHRVLSQFVNIEKRLAA
jgi:nucleoside-diphosphate-sugar epimerase